VSGTGAFSVQATGTAPLTYVWSVNGKAITNTNSDTFDTAPVSASDSGAKYTVTISNAAGAVTSTAAVLTVGPRSPKAGDLRFKLVDYAPTLVALASGNIAETSSHYFSNAIGTPLEVGDAGDCVVGVPFDCSWAFDTFDLPTGVTDITAYYASDNFNALASDIKEIDAPGIVISGLDEQPGNGVFAASWLSVGSTSNQPGGFEEEFHSAALAGLQDAANTEGLASRVITAVSKNTATGMVDYISYGWQTDTTTLYETKVVISSFTSVETDASNLAAEGYILTANGSGADNGFILVGTRVQGDTLPRPFASNSFPNPALTGAAPVARIFDSNGNAALSEQ
jgi:hypothetical protein